MPVMHAIVAGDHLAGLRTLSNTPLKALKGRIVTARLEDVRADGDSVVSDLHSRFSLGLLDLFYRASIRNSLH